MFYFFQCSFNYFEINKCRTFAPPLPKKMHADKPSTAGSVSECHRHHGVKRYLSEWLGCNGPLILGAKVFLFRHMFLLANDKNTPHSTCSSHSIALCNFPPPILRRQYLISPFLIYQRPLMIRLTGLEERTRLLSLD